jgi:hypothetical protein
MESRPFSDENSILKFFFFSGKKVPSPVDKYVRALVDSGEEIYAKLPPAVQELVLQYKAFIVAQADGDDSMIDEEFRKSVKERRIEIF